MLPILIYIGTLAYAPHWIFGLAIVYAVVKEEKINTTDFNNIQFYSIILIIALSLVNFIIHKFFSNHDDDIIPYTVLMLGSYIIAKRLSREALKTLIYLTVIECFFAYAEFALGIKTFFSGLESNVQNSDTSLLYYRSVFGLSDNSSSFAVKILLAYLLINFLGIKDKYVFVLRMLLIAGLVVSFNRTAMLVVILFHGLQFLSLFKRSAAQIFQLKMNKMVLMALASSFLLLTIVAYLAITNYETVLEQLTRRTSGIEITGRDWIWADYLEFISDHWILGNGSHKYFLISSGEQYHAHNSFLQTFANQGLVIGLFFILLIVLSINRYNFVYIISIVIYSMFQYGIFWGISMLDIIFIVFLLHKGRAIFADDKETPHAEPKTG